MKQGDLKTMFIKKNGSQSDQKTQTMVTDVRKQNTKKALFTIEDDDD